jgi:hypothetical protein
LESEEVAVLQRFVGMKLIGFSQAPNTGDFDSGDWRDDEPLCLTFEDGSVLKIEALGFHGSGGLVIHV